MTVRVPLDYYRVLMLSARADEHQIEQAYRERLDLKPGERSWLLEFSPQAVEARAQMIQEAASVLLNPEARRNYDEHLMPADPTLTVEEAHLPGVLCLYCEAGEYQAALDLAQHLLEQGHPARSDAILARAIARLELGREAWQQGSYEEAARSLPAGLRGWAFRPGKLVLGGCRSRLATSLGRLPDRGTPGTPPPETIFL